MLEAPKGGKGTEKGCSSRYTYNIRVTGRKRAHALSHLSEHRSKDRVTGVVLTRAQLSMFLLCGPKLGTARLQILDRRPAMDSVTFKVPL